MRLRYIRAKLYGKKVKIKTSGAYRVLKKSIVKQVAPLDFQKFLPKYSENQKWATPLIRPPFGDTKPPRLPLGGNSARKAPRGEGYIKGNY